MKYPVFSSVFTWPTIFSTVVNSMRNLLTYTEQFDNAVWTKTNATVATNAITAPNGTFTADKIIETTAIGLHNFGSVSGISTSLGSSITISVFAKAAERSFIAVYDGIASKGKFFDLSNGTIGGNLISAPTSASIVSFGNGWYRCSIVVTAGATSVPSVFLSPDGISFSYIGSASSGVYIWGAQLELGSTATAYQRVVS